MLYSIIRTGFRVRAADHFTKLQDCKTECDWIFIREFKQFKQLFIATKIKIFGGFQPNRRELPQFGGGGVLLGVKKIFFAFLDELDHV